MSITSAPRSLKSPKQAVLTIRNMSPREIRTDVVERADTKARLDLESRVLAAALKQSFERGDVEGVSLAHRQLFLLLKAGHKPDLGNGDAKRRLSSENITIPGQESDAQTSSEPADGVEEGAGAEVSEKADTDQGSEPNAEDDEKGAAKEEPAQPEAEEQARDTTEETTQEPEAKEKATSKEPTEEADSPQSQAQAEVQYDPSSDETLPPTQAKALIPPAQALSPRRRTEEFVEPPPNPWLQFGPDEGFASQVTTPLAVYELLDVAQVSSFEEIHRNFLRKVRRLLINEAKITDRKERFQALRKLQFLWIAHDILTDPVTRTDCDLRAIGLRGILDEIIPQAPEDASQGGPSNRTPLRIGELLLCAGLLEPTELEIAADMHKAMPEMMFGAFLVKQEFIEEDDLNTVLLGQKLLRSGVITVVQFQTAMEMKRKEGKELSDSLVSLGYVSQREIYAATASTQFGVNPGPPPERIEIVGQNAEGGQEHVAELTVGNAVPSWKDQLDWSEPERVHLPSVEPPAPPPPQPRKTMGSILIDGVTDFAESEPAESRGGKSSLRSLIAGIQAELTALDIANLTADQAEASDDSKAQTSDTTNASEGKTTEERSEPRSDTEREPQALPASETAAPIDSPVASEVDTTSDVATDAPNATTPSGIPENTDGIKSDAENDRRDRPIRPERLKLNIDFELESEKQSKAMEISTEQTDRSQRDTDEDLPSITNFELAKMKELNKSTETREEESRQEETNESVERVENIKTEEEEDEAQAQHPTSSRPGQDTFDAHPPGSGGTGTGTTSRHHHPHSMNELSSEFTPHVDRPRVRTDDSEWQVFPKREDSQEQSNHPTSRTESETDNFEPPQDENETDITDGADKKETSSPTAGDFPDPTLDAPPPHATLDETSSDDEPSPDDDPDSDSQGRDAKLKDADSSKRSGKDKSRHRKT